MGFTVEEIFASVNTDNTEGLALSQEGNPQTHSGTLLELQHIFDFSQHDYQLRSTTEVHVGLLPVYHPAVI